MGVVYKGRWMGTTVAVKQMRGDWKHDADAVARFRTECQIMSCLRHPNILMFVGAVFDKERCEYCLVTEFCEHGDLASYLADSEKPMNWKLRFIMCMDIARAMMYLHHKAGIIQRDLKSENLLIHEDFHVKLGDFGLSRTLRPGQMETFCGTPTHVAPEIVRQEDYTDKADVFSFGIILWELVTRSELWRQEVVESGAHLMVALRDAVVSGTRPTVPTDTEFSEEFITLM